jgi:hypothetical protein
VCRNQKSNTKDWTLVRCSVGVGLLANVIEKTFFFENGHDRGGNFLVLDLRQGSVFRIQLLKDAGARVAAVLETVKEVFRLPGDAFDDRGTIHASQRVKRAPEFKSRRKSV